MRHHASKTHLNRMIWMCLRMAPGSQGDALRPRPDTSAATLMVNPLPRMYHCVTCTLLTPSTSSLASPPIPPLTQPKHITVPTAHSPYSSVLSEPNADKRPAPSWGSHHHHHHPGTQINWQLPASCMLPGVPGQGQPLKTQSIPPSSMPTSQAASTSHDGPH